MANVKFSAFPAASAMADADYLVGLQGGINVKATALQFKTYIASTLTATRIPFMGASVLADDDNFTWDNTNKVLRVGPSASNPILIHGTGENVFVGHNSANLNYAYSGGFNTFVGGETGRDITSAGNNVFVGYAAGDVITTGSGNTFVGYAAGQTQTTGATDQVILGNHGGTLAPSGTGQVIVGSLSGSNLGANGVVIGYNVDVTATAPGYMSIQNIIYGIDNNGTGVTASTGKVGIGIAIPLEKLQIAGNLKLGTAALAGSPVLSIASSSTDADLVVTPKGAGVLAVNSGITTTGKIASTSTTTTAGFNPGSFAGDPSSLSNGDVWYNSTTGRQRVRIGGTSRSVNDATDLIGIVPTTSGGIGLSTIGTAGQVVTVNAGGTALEYQTPAGAAAWAVTGNTNITTPTITGVPTFIGNIAIQNSNITTTSTDGDVIENATASTVGVQVQQSPRTRYRAHAWITGSAADRTGDFIIENIPAAGTSVITQTLRIATSNNGGALVNQLQISDAGTLTVGSTLGTVNILGSGALLNVQNITLSNNNTRMVLTMPVGAITEGFRITSNATPPNTFDGVQYIPTAYTFASTTGNIYNMFNINQGINTTGTYTGTITGYNFNPTLTSTTGATILAFRAVSGNILFGATTITASTRLDLRGTGTTTNIAFRIADSGNTLRFTFLDNGSVGFFGVAAAAQQTSAADLTNNVTSGGTTDTIANYTDLTIYANDAAAIRNDIYQLSRKLKQLNDGLRLFGLFT